MSCIIANSSGTILCASLPHQKHLKNVLRFVKKQSPNMALIDQKYYYYNNTVTIILEIANVPKLMAVNALYAINSAFLAQFQSVDNARPFSCFGFESDLGAILMKMKNGQLPVQDQNINIPNLTMDSRSSVLGTAETGLPLPNTTKLNVQNTHYIHILLILFPVLGITLNDFLLEPHFVFTLYHILLMPYSIYVLYGTYNSSTFAPFYGFAYLLALAAYVTLCLIRAFMVGVHKIPFGIALLVYSVYFVMPQKRSYSKIE
eukprot:NODE_69_length_23719_cov_0.556689.p8 type:complete len:260 gc:universal NODE_69_length_23719_cov_0.556689:5134-5913(+)